MPKHRFHLVPVHHDYRALENTLNDLADEGWEYRDICKRATGNQFIILTRQIGDSEEIQRKAVLDDGEVRQLKLLPDGSEEDLGRLELGQTGEQLLD